MNPRLFRGQDQGAHHIVDVDEVAGLMAVAEDDDRTAVEGVVHEPGDDRGVGMGHGLPGTVGVEDAQRDGFEAVESGNAEQVVLRRDLGNRVGHAGLQRCILGYGLPGLGTVDGGAAGEDYTADPHIPAGLEQGYGATGVDRVVGPGVVDGFRHVGERGEVKHDINVLQQPPEERQVVDIPFLERDAPVQELRLAVAQVVKYANRPSQGVQTVGEMQSEEPGSAGYKRAHCHQLRGMDSSTELRDVSGMVAAGIGRAIVGQHPVYAVCPLPWRSVCDPARGWPAAAVGPVSFRQRRLWTDGRDRVGL